MKREREENERETEQKRERREREKARSPSSMLITSHTGVEHSRAQRKSSNFFGT